MKFCVSSFKFLFFHILIRCCLHIIPFLLSLLVYFLLTLKLSLHINTCKLKKNEKKLFIQFDFFFTNHCNYHLYREIQPLQKFQNALNINSSKTTVGNACYIGTDTCFARSKKWHFSEPASILDCGNKGQ